VQEVEVDAVAAQELEGRAVAREGARVEEAAQAREREGAGVDELAVPAGHLGGSSGGGGVRLTSPLARPPPVPPPTGSRGGESTSGSPAGIHTQPERCSSMAGS
jgi:hypothetical protein